MHLQENTYSLNVNRKTLYIMQASSHAAKQRCRRAGMQACSAVSDPCVNGPTAEELCTLGVIPDRAELLNLARRLSGPQCTAEGDRPIELAFLENYGNIMKHAWFGEGYILLGFRNGYVVVVSSHSREINEEVHSGK